MDDEEETCRICHCGSEVGAPLYYPCKCHGSIRHVHQDCLIQWLSHSRKKYCELCQHPFVFHKRYASNMPEGTLPFRFYLHRLAKRSFSTLLLGLRAVLVAFMWLAVLPLTNMYVWRFQFNAADILAAGLGATVSGSSSDAAAANSTQASGGLMYFLRSLTKSQTQWTGWGLEGIFPSWGIAMVPPPADAGSTSVTVKSVFQELLHDCFEGQILTCVVIVIVVGIFLLRDWIHQNIPPRPAAAPRNPVVAAPVPAPAPAVAADAAPAQPGLLPTADPVNLQPTARLVFGSSGRQQEDDEWDDIEEVVDSEQSGQKQESATAPSEPELDREALQARRLQHFEALLGTGGSNGYKIRVKPPLTDEQSNFNLASSTSLHKEILTEMPKLSDMDAKEKYLDEDVDDTPPLSRDAKGKMRMTTEEEVLEAKTSESITTSSTHLGLDEDASARNSDSVLPEKQEQGLEKFLVGVEQADSSGDDAVVGTQMGRNKLSDEAEDDDDEEASLDASMIGAAETSGVAASSAVPIAEPQEGLDPLDRPGVQAVLNDMAGFGEAFDEAWDDVDALDAAAIAEQDAELGEDLDGLLDAIGMVGSLTILFQNVALVSVLCSFLILFFAAIPYTWGKTMSALDFAGVFVLPVHLLRYITDPLFDFLFAAVVNLGAICAVSLKSIVPARLTDLLSSIGSLAGGYYSFLLDFVSMIAPTTSSDNIVKDVANGLPTWTAAYWNMLPDSARSPHSLLEAGNFIASGAASAAVLLYAKLEDIRNGSSLSNRIVCILLGHTYWLCSLAAQATLSKFLPIPHLKWARTWLTEQVVLLRVLLFLLFELVAFPILCGILLDFCVSPLVSTTGTVARLQDLALSTFFIHWVVGTVYTFMIAQFVSMIRKVLRPGVLWFIRDPSDTDYQPIKEILERPLGHYLRKIGISILMYLGVGLCLFGCNVHFVRWLAPTSMPLRWKPHDPASPVPYDLILLHIVLPLIVNKAKPSLAFRNSVRQWTILAARVLRLSDFLLGHKRAEERYIYKSSWAHWWRRIAGRMDVADLIETRVHDSGYARVLANNVVPLVPPLFVRSDAEGRPIDPADQPALDRQSRIIDKMAHKPKYIVVFTPPNLRRRIITFLVFAWLSIAIALVGVVLLPIAIGRWSIAWISQHQLHDFYPFVVGCAVIWAMMRASRAIIRTLRIRPSSHRRSRSKIRSQSPSHLRRRLRRTARRCVITITRFAKLAYLCFTLLGIMPSVYGLVLYRYVVVPLRFSSSTIPEIPLTQCWAIGCLFINVSLVARRQSRIYRHLRALPSNLRRPPIYKITRHYLIPELLQWITAFVGPQIVVGIAFKLFPWIGRSTSTDQMWLRGAYDFTLGYLFTYDLTVLLIRKMNGWTGVLRDELFLESTELRNYQPIDREELHNLPPASIALPPSPPLMPHLEADGPVPDVLVERR